MASDDKAEKILAKLISKPPAETLTLKVRGAKIKYTISSVLIPVTKDIDMELHPSWLRGLDILSFDTLKSFGK